MKALVSALALLTVTSAALAAPVPVMPDKATVALAAPGQSGGGDAGAVVRAGGGALSGGGVDGR